MPQRLAIRTGQTLALALLLGCSEPIALTWKKDLGAASLSTPLITDQYIAVGTDRGLVILEKDGQQRCRLDTGEVVSRPTTDGDRIFFGSTNYIFYAVDARCQEVWKFGTRDRIKSDPLVALGKVFTASYDGHLYALDAASGEMLWRFPNFEAVAAAAALPAMDLPPPAKPEGRKKTAAKGKLPQKQVTPDIPEAPAGPTQPERVGDFSYSSPVLVGEVLYLGNLDNHLYAIDAKHGKMLWRYRTRAAITSSPTVLEDTIYFGSNDGNVYALASDGQGLRWKAPTRDWVNSSARIVDEVIFIGSNDRHLYAIDSHTGAILWKHRAEGPMIAVPAVYQSLVFAAGASGDGRIYAFDREDGGSFWTYQTGGKIESDLVIDGDKLYVSSSDHYLYAFQIRRTNNN